MKLRCPVCKNVIVSPSEGEKESCKYFPFCSERCKLIDLGAWLDSDYKITTPAHMSQTNEQTYMGDDI